MSTFSTRLLLVFAWTVVGSFVSAQEDSRKRTDQPQDSTLQGRIVQHSEKRFEIKLSELKCMLNQQVELPAPPVPKQQWPKMTPTQREEWVKNFEASEQGKKFIEDRRKRIAAAESFDVQIEENGKFVVYDVPPGIYGFRGRMVKSLDSREYVFEAFGQIEVDKDVEVQLDPIPVVVTRLLKAGEPVPTVEVFTFDKKTKIDNKLLKGRNVMVNFWSLDSPPSVEFSKVVQKTFEEVNANKEVQLLCVCIAGDRDKALKYVVDNKLAGWHGFVESWDDKTVTEFGVRSIPVLFLLGKDDRTKMTPAEFRAAMSAPGAKLSGVIVDVLNGKSIPTPMQTASPANASSDQKQ